MRPCDCISMQEVHDKLNEAGLRFNDCAIQVEPLRVVLTHGPATISFPMKTFQLLCEWYLRDQAVLTARYDRYDGVIEVGKDGSERWIKDPDGKTHT